VGNVETKQINKELRMRLTHGAGRRVDVEKKCTINHRGLQCKQKRPYWVSATRAIFISHFQIFKTSISVFVQCLFLFLIFLFILVLPTLNSV